MANAHATLVFLKFLLPAVVLGGLLGEPVLAEPAPGDRPAAHPDHGRFAPYDTDPDHLWNQLHQALFVREAPSGSRRVHVTDPLLYRGGTFLLAGESHRRAMTLLDQVLQEPDQRTNDDTLKRLFFQRDLWAAFDYVARYPDDFMHRWRNEPAALALRSRLSQAIGRLALDRREIAALPDNFALAVKSMQYPAAHDPDHPERPFLPADLFDPTGTWVRIHETDARPMTERHFAGAGGRAVHIVLLRLPGGRAATEAYLKELNRDSMKQFPTGTMVALVRRSLTVDRSAKVRVTPVTELVQLRVYRRIPADLQAHSRGDFGAQDVYEFVLDRTRWYAGHHGLRAVDPEELEEPFMRDEGNDPFERRGRAKRPSAREPTMLQLKTCIQCHQQPGIHSVRSMRRGLRSPGSEPFRTYAWDVEMSYTVGAKVKQFNWGLLQGRLESR